MDTLTRMRAFVQVVNAGGFSAAARTVGRSKALVSKHISELEDDLGVRLLNRTTRQLSMTEAGETYFRDAVEILHRVDDLMESVKTDNSVVKGRLKVSVPRTMGDGEFGSALAEFSELHPEVHLQVQLEDRFVNLVEEGFDCALRIAELDDSSLIAKKVAAFSVVTCAAPDLIRRVGHPMVPEDLGDKPCVLDANNRMRSGWTFSSDEGRKVVTVRGRFEANSPYVVRRAALQGLGFARMPWILVRDLLETGELVEVLKDYRDEERALYLVYPHRRHLPVKTRAFIDFTADWFAQRERDAESGELIDL